ncbi:MAG: TIGR02757 family protein [Bacteroidetes bacterium]|nr:TIGR02757 family protein [Bacteroidota bacterium]
MNTTDLKSFLDEKYNLYNNKDFIGTDPIQIPHQFAKKEDIEIAGFLIATIAWGQRKSIIANGNKWMDFMDNNPHEFITNASPKEISRLDNFVHRTFNGTDCVFFIKSLRNIYKKFGSMETAFTDGLPANKRDSFNSIALFRERFFETKHLPRSQKHVSNPVTGSSSKRLCMYLRWMCRNDKRGVDFGIWNTINPKDLYLPLDVHTGNVGRKLGLLNRTQNDWKAVEEITINLRKLDAKDPIKYDFALFGLGAFDKF